VHESTLAPTLPSAGIPIHHGGQGGDAMAARKSSRVNRRYKTKYRIRNWREYEHGLRSRGDITIWLSDEAIAATRPMPFTRWGASFERLGLATVNLRMDRYEDLNGRPQHLVLNERLISETNQRCSQSKSATLPSAVK